jgi:hypothetical protein
MRGIILHSGRYWFGRFHTHSTCLTSLHDLL